MVKITTKTLATWFVFVSILSLVSACSIIHGSSPASITPLEALSANAGFLPSGSIIISSPIPSAITPTPLRLFGFLPSADSEKISWLSVDRARGRVALMHGSEEVSSIRAEGVDFLMPGTYSLVHKQRAPLWHAPDSYFTARNLPVPPEGDAARFRRGALGEAALFIDPQTPLHSALAWSSEVGGVRLEEPILDRLYSELPVGAVVEVK